jgi:hypothetical protein
MNYPIIRQFRSPEVLQTEVGRGGSDEVLWIGKVSLGCLHAVTRGKIITVLSELIAAIFNPISAENNNTVESS